MFRLFLTPNGASQRMTSCGSMRICLARYAGLALVLLAQPAVAGPPFVSDDPGADPLPPVRDLYIQ